MPTIINIEQLRENIDFIATSMASYMCDCLVICLTEAGHSVGVDIKVETDLKDYDFSIFWETKVTQHLIGATRDEQRTTEWVAMGFAFILVRYLTEYPYIRTSRKGSGIDFFLSKNPTELSCDARLEISGIKKTSAKNTIVQRFEVKKKQTKLSDDTATPVFISITEFSEPKSLFKQK